MTTQLQGWTPIGIVAAWALLSGLPAQADVTVGAAIWTCQNEGSDQATARLDVTRLSNLVVDEEGVRLSAVDEPFTCSFPWGQLQVEVTEYYSPQDHGMCGAVEVWGLKVTADGHVLEDIPSDSARSCHWDNFNPFKGWVEVDAERVVVCRARRDRSTHDCETTRVEEFQAEVPVEIQG